MSGFSSAAFSYIGPGAGLTAFGSLLALIVAVLIGIVGFLWYPIKRLMKKRRNKVEDHSNSNTQRKTEEPD